MDKKIEKIKPTIIKTKHGITIIIYDKKGSYATYFPAWLTRK